ncbi:OmpH/Skp family outer membrane protein [Acinetobacter tandoii]|jgi:outer membrane protein|uniref:Outer membrane protein n=1 Tax=Acinetobacter tandoii DSM 14970 = CIP 107469 TaxID=1120927 RepID=R9AUF4_9GAMM|nr:OmpH family outer membrane protein [Acinetobacter tandoii]EOR05874.1 outer membrane protein [Acinetobacter tandoii DSM 14970 = CIP 107469]
MRKIIKALAIASVSLSSMVHAAGYGVVDLEQVVENSTYLKAQNATLQQSIKPQTTRLEQLGKELEAMKQKAQTSKLSEAEMQKMSAEYQTKLNELNGIQQGLQGKVQASLQVMNKTLDSRIKQVAEQLRKEGNLDVVLNKNSALAYDAKYDLTDKMIQKVNAIK